MESNDVVAFHAICRNHCRVCFLDVKVERVDAHTKVDVENAEKNHAKQASRRVSMDLVPIVLTQLHEFHDQIERRQNSRDDGEDTVN